MGKPLNTGGKGGGNSGKNGKKTELHEGTEENDVMICGDGTESVFAMGGDDTITSSLGNDYLDGGEGSDTYLVDGFAGVNTYHDTGTEGWDVILAEAKATDIYVNDFGPHSGIEEISAGGFGGVDIMDTNDGNVMDFSATVLTGIDLINAQGGDDTVIGSNGDDTILGGAGNDTINGGDGADAIFLGSGNDTVLATSVLDAGDTVYDFNPEEDVLDISQLLADPNYAGHTFETVDSGVALIAELSDGSFNEVMTFVDHSEDDSLDLTGSVIF